MGVKGSETSIITSHELATSNSKANDFTISFKRPAGDYDKLKLSFEAFTNQVILLNLRLSKGDIHLVEQGEAIFLNLKKDELMNFKIEG